MPALTAIDRLRELDEDLTDVSVPLSYMEDAYSPRLHVAYLLDKFVARQADSPAPGPDIVRLRRAA